MGGKGLYVTALDKAEMRYHSYIVDPVFGPIGDDFAIEAGVGYFVGASADTAFTLTGYFPDVSSTSLQQGWNLIGYSSLQPEMASQLLERVGGLALTCFDEESGGYLTYIQGWSPEDDYLVTPGNAYYIWVVGPCDLVFA
jgi:hypothetical protein